MANVSNSTNRFGTAEWIVDAAGFGTSKTIAEALTSSSSGDTIFIRPGTYTENPTLKAGVNIATFISSGRVPNVIINGKCTFTGAGTVAISGVCLQTNSDFFLAVTGSADSIIYLNNCYLNILNHTGISYTSSSGSSVVFATYCPGTIGTTGIAIFSSSGAGLIQFDYCDINNAGNSITPSTVSAGTFISQHTVYNSPVAISGTGLIIANYSEFFGDSVTSVAITSQTTHEIINSYLVNGTGSCVSIDTGCSCLISNCTLLSDNTNVFTGAGSVSTGGNVCLASHGNNVSSITNYTTI